MGLKTATRYFAAWIAFLAMLFGVLAPSMSMSMSMSILEQNLAMEVCSVGGMKMGDGAAAASSTKQAAKHIQHCPLCVTHAGSFALPPTAGFAIPIVAVTYTHPPLFFHSPRPLAIWTVAQSRAPPIA